MSGQPSAVAIDMAAQSFGTSISRRSSQRPAAVALVAAVHLIAVWTLFANIRPAHVFVPPLEFQLTVLKPAVTSTRLPPPPREWKLEQPTDVFVPEPQIQIEPDPEAPATTTSMASDVLPPRPDPYYINKAPDVPDNLKPEAAKAAVTLRILILADGFVDQALLVKSSSNPALDKLALAFVAANWRFLPATSGGKPIEDWTTVRVRFAS